MFWYTFTPFSRKLGSRSCTFPILRSLSLPGTRPLTCEGGKVLRTEKKNPKSRKRFCSPTSLASSLGAKQRRKVEKRAETQICAHLYTSLVPQAVNGELKGYFLAYFSDLLRVCSLFAHRGFFCHVSINSRKSHPMKFGRCLTAGRFQWLDSTEVLSSRCTSIKKKK